MKLWKKLSEFTKEKNKEKNLKKMFLILLKIL